LRSLADATAVITSLLAVVDTLDVTATDVDDVTLLVATASPADAGLSASVFSSAETAAVSVLTSDDNSDDSDDVFVSVADVAGSSSFIIFIITSSFSHFLSTFRDIQSSMLPAPILKSTSGISGFTSADPPAELSGVKKSMLCPVENFTRSDASDIMEPGTSPTGGTSPAGLLPTPADGVDSNLTAEKSNFPAGSVSILPVSDIIESVPGVGFNPDIETSELALAVALSQDVGTIESVLGVGFNPDIETSELALAVALSRDVGTIESVLGAAERLDVDIKESVLGVIGRREFDIKPADDVTRLDLARLRRDDVDDDVTGLPATSVVLASSMSRSLSSLR